MQRQLYFVVLRPIVETTKFKTETKFLALKYIFDNECSLVGYETDLFDALRFNCNRYQLCLFLLFVCFGNLHLLVSDRISMLSSNGWCRLCS